MTKPNGTNANAAGGGPTKIGDMPYSRIDIDAECRALEEAARRAARVRWDDLAKPLGSLGLLEQAIGQIAAITGSPEVTLERRALAVLCADNGVVAQGVTQTDSSVTAAVSFKNKLYTTS